MARRRFRFRRMRARVRHARRATRRGFRALAPLRRAGARVGAAFPSWAKPSKVTAMTGVAAGVGELIFTPIPNGSGGVDSWVRRLAMGYGNYKTSGNPMDILAVDDFGNDITTIAVAQIKQNAPGAVGTMAGFGIVAAVLRWAGM